jgi:fatty acid desaturase
MIIATLLRKFYGIDISFMLERKYLIVLGLALWFFLLKRFYTVERTHSLTKLFLQKSKTERVFWAAMAFVMTIGQGIILPMIISWNQ